MKHKPSQDLQEDITFYSMLIKTIPLVSAAVSAAVLPLALYDTFTANALVVYGCAAAGSVLLVLHLRRRARRALADALVNEAFIMAEANYDSVVDMVRDVSAAIRANHPRPDDYIERLDRLERVLDGWEKGVVPERDWHIMSGGKPLPEHLRK